MKNFLTLLLPMLLPLGLSAQITVTNATFPGIGDTLRLAFETAPSGDYLASVGANFNLDFSGLGVTYTQDLVYRPAIEGSVGMQLNNAELFTNLGANTEGYYNVTATAVEWVALNGPDPIGIGIETLFKFNPPLIERRAPLTYPSVNLANAALLLPISSDAIPGAILDSLPIVPDSFRIRVTSSRSDFVDAWGKLTIPGGTYEVLREKRTEYRDTRIDILLPFLGWQDVTDLLLTNPMLANLGKDAIITYNYFNDEEKEPIAVVTTDAQEMNASQVMYKNNGPSVDSKNLLQAQAQLSVFPNPVAGEAIFELKNWPSGIYTLEISDASGTTVWKKALSLQGDTFQRADVAGFAAGPYFFRLWDVNGNLLNAGQLIKL